MQIGAYRIVAEIGRGAMATVYLADDTRLNRQVAIKILSPQLMTDREFRTRFMREMRAAAWVDHPSIVPIFDAGETDRNLYIAMRYVAGGDAKTALRKRGPFPLDYVLAVIKPIASALGEVHDRGMVHRDVKPSNILLSTERHVHPYLSDFGLSKEIWIPGRPSDMSLPGVTSANSAVTGRSSLTGSRVIGTPDYLAPEQAISSQPSARSDQYSFACSTFELLSGRPPFSGLHFLAVIEAHCNRPAPRVTNFRPDLPRVIDDVLAIAMAKEPQNRYPSCTEFVTDIQRVLSRASGRSTMISRHFRSRSGVGRHARAGPHYGVAR
jgi:serine/threonine protein kinase